MPTFSEIFSEQPECYVDTPEVLKQAYKAGYADAMGWKRDNYLEDVGWIGLTDEEIDPAAEQSDNYAAFHSGVRFAEAKLREKNA